METNVQNTENIPRQNSNVKEWEFALYNKSKLWTCRQQAGESDGSSGALRQEIHWALQSRRNWNTPLFNDSIR